MKKIICLIFAVSITCYSNALEPEECRLVLKAENFIVDYEYFSPNIEGYTVLGANIDPSLQISWNKSLRLNLGVRIRPIFGEDDSIPLYWLYRLQYNSKKNWIITFGDIEIRNKQILPDYIIFNNMRFEESPDNGLLVASPDKWLQLFVIWDDYIFPESSHQEKLLAGSLFNPEFLRGNMSVRIPCSFTAAHVGGQIDSSSEPVKTWYHGNLGLQCAWTFSSVDIGVKLSTAIYGFDSKDTSGLSEDGRLINSSIFAKSRNLTFSVEYFKMNDWYHPYGNPIYRNTRDSNRLLTYSGTFEKKLSEIIEVSSQMKFYYNLEDKRTDFDLSATCSFNLALTKNWMSNK